jgi:hypothetical protein
MRRPGPGFFSLFTTKALNRAGPRHEHCYAIIKEHGGDLYIKESAPGKGTSIEIRLPYPERKKIAGNSLSARHMTVRKGPLG